MMSLPQAAYTIEKMQHPVAVQVVEIAELIASEQALFNCQVRTVAGRVNIRGVSCLVLNEDEDQFILGKDVLASLGIDAGTMIDQLAASPVHDYDDDDLDLPICDVGVDA